MRTQRWLMAVALLFWGWQTNLLLWSVVMAAALEASSIVPARWQFKEADINRVCDLCWVLLLGAALLSYSTEERLVFIFKFVQWLPFCFYPIVLAQAYGDQEVIPLSAFYWLLRRWRQSSRTFRISFAYFTVCLAAASASNRPNGFFYIGMAFLVVIALASVRPRHVSLPLWILLAAMVVWAGHVGHQRLRGLQNTLEVALGSWISEFFQQSPDMYESRTRMGQARRISQSRKVLLRVRVPPGQIPPSLLREGVFDTYTNQTWYARSNNEFFPVHGANGSFHLLRTKQGSAETEIASYFENGKGPLALPHGVFEIEGLPANLRTNNLGVCSIEGGPGLVMLRARYGGGVTLDAPPGIADTNVPANERPTLERLAQELKLSTMSPRQRIRAVGRFFGNGFTYSLSIPPHRFRNSRTGTELAWFVSPLGRVGHCEYFASATVLLLRQAAIPARYVTGYEVPESARHGDTYLVRERHRHAWALVYHEDTQIWEQIDTTPSSRDLAEARPAWWETAADFLSNLIFDFSKWRWTKASFTRTAEWLLAPMILYLVWRILSTQRQQRAQQSSKAAAGRESWPGLDSELFLIHRRLSGGRFARLPNESLSEWQKRLEEASPPSNSRLRRVFHLHHRLRFDPHGLAASDRQILKREAERWLTEFSALSAIGEARRNT
jgi:hypothetical protein